jgi:hypothetical protein
VLILSGSGRTRVTGEMTHRAGPDPGTLTLGQAPEVIGNPDRDNGPPQPRAGSGHASDKDYDDDHALVASFPSDSRLALHRRRSHMAKQTMTRIVMSNGQPVLTAGPRCSNDA